MNKEKRELLLWKKLLKQCFCERFYQTDWLHCSNYEGEFEKNYLGIIDNAVCSFGTTPNRKYC